MRRFRGFYWRLRANISANWWMLRFDLTTAWLFLRYAYLALQGRLIVMDEQVIESRGGYIYLQLALSNLPPTGDEEPPTARPARPER